MNDDRDPVIGAVFADAKEELVGGEFTAGVMWRTDQLKRRAMFGWLLSFIAIAAGFWILAGPLQEVAGLMNQVLPTTLVDMENRIVGQLLAPVNSIAGPIAIMVLGLNLLYRRFFA
jgi:hypothetical protein